MNGAGDVTPLRRAEASELKHAKGKKSGSDLNRPSWTVHYLWTVIIKSK